MWIKYNIRQILLWFSILVVVVVIKYRSKCIEKTEKKENRRTFLGGQKVNKLLREARRKNVRIRGTATESGGMYGLLSLHE